MDKDKNSLFRYISKFDTDSSVTLFNKGCFIPINVMFLMLMSYLPYISLSHLKGLRMIFKPTI